ncbi:MAG: NUDIX hydrolase [Brevibacterium sp.]
MKDVVEGKDVTDVKDAGEGKDVTGVKDIRVSALVLFHPDREELLMVRKTGTSSFMLPGGKPEPGESPEETIIREIDEELGLQLFPERLSSLGTFTAAAANEAEHTVTGDVFSYEGVPPELNVEAVEHLAEIAEAIWVPFDPLPSDTAERQFAPLTRYEVIPALKETGLLPR